MKTYSVKQIAEILDTNPETVRRWIRSNKLRAVQMSRKDGNVVREDEFRRFLEAMPKYLPKFMAGIALVSPPAGLITLASSLVTSALVGYFEEKGKVDAHVCPEDLKEYLQENVNEFKNVILQKEKLITQTQKEIQEIQNKVEQYLYLIEHEEVIKETIKTISVDTIGKK